MKLVIHAPTPAALEHARNNAANALKAAPDTEVCLILNAGAVAAALSTPHPMDSHTLLCRITLDRMELELRAPLTVTEGPAVLEIAKRQQEGWIYIRA